MVRPRLARIVLLAVLVLAAGCSCAESPGRLVAPPGDPVITGRVKLVAEGAAELGDLLDPIVVNDADGVRVRLRRPDGGVDSTTTIDGAFSFVVGAPGTYRASCGIEPADTTVSAEVTVTDADAAFPDTLTLGSVGELKTYPNPFDAAHGLAIEFTTVAAQQVRVTVLDFAGVAHWDQGVDLPADFFLHYHWSGTNQDFEPLPAGPYWVVIRRDGGTHARLVFKE